MVIKECARCGIQYEDLERCPVCNSILLPEGSVKVIVGWMGLKGKYYYSPKERRMKRYEDQETKASQA